MGVLNNLLTGKRVRAVLTRGNQLAIVLDDNTEVVLGWFTEEGEPANGRPALCRAGGRVNMQSVNQLIAEAAPTQRSRMVGGMTAVERRAATVASAQQHLLPPNYRY